ncbi:hypothetical protein [uncultured Clostridium sp.]|uniref:hypothetical protein n=1 Tax=uncultured Clostridium sp. TaxID=59620 RepID=UPI0025E902C3|nr:hypothetical protein [uncultured Clostridium sp.]MDU4883105.1 hypothetical protein [Clostridium celatum]MDU7076175.1 hypothetical protein [Clostridium celatum]
MKIDILLLGDLLKVYRERIESIDDSNDLKKYFVGDYELLLCCENTMNTEYGKKKGLILYIEYSNGVKYPDIDNFEEERK